MKTFENLHGGDIVKFRVRSGTTAHNGKTVAQWSVRTAKVNPLLLFEDHVVVNHTSTGAVVDRSNFISLVIK